MGVTADRHVAIGWPPLYLQFVDNLSFASGRHFLKAGVDLRRIRTKEFALFRQRGQYIFNSFQDFATNTMRPGNAIRTFGPGLYEGRTTALYTYVQDDFRVNPRLTLNLGLRYEVHTVIGGFGRSRYHSGQFSATKRFSPTFTVNAAYTISRFRDQVSEPLATTFATPIFPQDFDNLEAEWGRSLYDRPHRLVVSYVVPLGLDRWGGPRWLAEGWQVAGITTVQSGQPYTVLNGVDANADNQSGNDRVDFNPGGAPGSVSLAVPIRNSNGALIGYSHSNPNARYLQLGAQTGRTGNIGRNSERTDTTTNFDFTVSKKTRLAGRTKVEFRAEIFNVFNTRQFGIPTDAGNAFSAVTSSFVTVSSPNFTRADIGAGSARIVQLAARVEF